MLEVTDPGSVRCRRSLRRPADLRTDCARYAIYRDGVRTEDRTDIRDLWRDDLVTFLIGSGISIDGALENAGVPTHKDRWVLRTTLPTEPAGPFRGDMIVTMRWLTGRAGDHRDAGDGAVSVQPRRADPPRRSGRDRRRPRRRRCSAARCRPRPTGIVPVFWACGVTPQSAAENAQLPFFIAHAPAHSFITDMPAEALMTSVKKTWSCRP